MKIIVIGNQHEEIFEPTEAEYSSLLQGIVLTNEIRNRDNPQDKRKVIESDIWPLPDPEE